MAMREVSITLMLGKNAREDAPAHHVLEAGSSRWGWRLDRERGLLIIRPNEEERFEYPIENLAGWRISMRRVPAASDSQPEKEPTDNNNPAAEHTIRPTDRDREADPSENLPIILYDQEVWDRLENREIVRANLAKNVSTLHHGGPTHDVVIHNVPNEEDFEAGLLVWLI